MRWRYKGFALLGTVAAIVAWILMMYGMSTVQTSQFQMLISGKDAINAQKLAEVDSSLIKLVDYDELTDDSALGELNLHSSRGVMRTVTADGWQDEIKFSEERNNGSDSDYGNYRIATVNIYKEGDVVPRFSLQTPALKYAQPYIRKDIDKFIEERKAKDRELEAKDRELEAKDKELDAKDKELDAKDRQLAIKDTELDNRLTSLESEILSQLPLCDCPPCPLDEQGDGGNHPGPGDAGYNGDSG